MYSFNTLRVSCHERFIVTYWFTRDINKTRFIYTRSYEIFDLLDCKISMLIKTFYLQKFLTNFEHGDSKCT